jgi:hypothetical protein
VRLGERAVHTGVEQVQHGVDRLVQASIDRLAPVRRAREEMSGLRARLEQLEASLAALDSEVMVGLAESPQAADGASPGGTERADSGAEAGAGAAAAARLASGNGSLAAGAQPASAPTNLPPTPTTPSTKTGPSVEAD